MRVLLVMPTPFENGRLGLENVVWLSEPVALTTVGASITNDHDVRVIDMRLEDEEALAKMLASWRPDVVGTTSMTTDAYQAKACDEPFIFVLDENFLTNARRATELCEELEQRRVKKYWLTQGRTDFAADHPELMAPREERARDGAHAAPGDAAARGRSLETASRDPARWRDAAHGRAGAARHGVGWLFASPRDRVGGRRVARAIPSVDSSDHRERSGIAMQWQNAKAVTRSKHALPVVG